MKYPVFFLLISLGLFWACKKNSLPGAPGNMLNKTVSTLSANSSWQVTDSFVYDGQRRVSQVIRGVINPIAWDTVTFQYDASGRVASWIESVTSNGRFVEYLLSYDGNGRLVKETAVPLVPNMAWSDYTFTYNTAGQLIADTIYAQHLADSISPGIMTYEQWTYDKNGNAITDQGFGSTNSNLIGAPFKSTGTTSYQYDSHVNPYYGTGVPFYAMFGLGPQLLSPNNVTGSTTTGAGTISPARYSFAYYNNDRPRQQTTSVSGASGMQTETIAYYYQ